MTWREWYDGLIKPGWTPEPSTIGLIWQSLYPISLVTFGYIFFNAFRNKLPWRVAIPFAINLAANLLYTPIQFGLRNLSLAAIDILIVLVTIPAMMFVTWKDHRWIAIAQVPYLIWVSLATILQLSITWWNH